MSHHDHHPHHHDPNHHHHPHHNSPIDPHHSSYRRHSTGSLVVEHHQHPHSHSGRRSVSLYDLSTSRAPYHHQEFSVRSVGSPMSQVHHHEEHHLEHHHGHDEHHMEHHEHHDDHHHPPHHSGSKKSIKTEAPFNIHHPDPELVAQSMEADKVDDKGPQKNGQSFEAMACCCFCVIALVTVIVTFVLIFFSGRK